MLFANRLIWLAILLLAPIVSCSEFERLAAAQNGDKSDQAVKASDKTVPGAATPEEAFAKATGSN